MSVSRVAGRYATAFYDYAGDDKSREALIRDAARVVAIIEANDDLAGMLVNPVIPERVKHSALAAVLRNSVGDLLLKTIDFLRDKKRLALTGPIMRTLIRTDMDRRGIVVADVLTPYALNEKQTKALAENLSTQTGKHVTVAAKVDESLISGLRIRIGDGVIDSSASHKLDRLARSLKN